MLTYETLRRQPHRFAELRGSDVRVGAAAGGDPAPTLVFDQRAVALMKAERAEQIDKLRQVIRDESLIIPLQKKPGSFWDHVTVGRASTADIVLDDPAVSNVHAHF